MIVHARKYHWQFRQAGQKMTKQHSVYVINSIQKHCMSLSTFIFNLSPSLTLNSLESTVALVSVLSLDNGATVMQSWWCAGQVVDECVPCICLCDATKYDSSIGVYFLQKYFHFKTEAFLVMFGVWCFTLLRFLVGYS